jgi:hypothetical protein
MPHELAKVGNSQWLRGSCRLFNYRGKTPIK